MSDDAHPAVAAFVAALRAASPMEREAMMEELEATICLLCGDSDTACECWLKAESEPTPS